MTTAGETLGTLFPISVSFVQGEQPSSGKFSGWANQTSAALSTLAKSIGDLWGEEFTNNKLYVSTHRPPHIMNLARLIGPASALNPVRPVSTGSGSPSGRVEYNVVLDPDDIPIGTNEFNLRSQCDCSPPLDWTAAFPQGSVVVHTSIEAVLEYISTTAGETGNDIVFGQHVASRTLLATYGDYHVDLHGNVFTYNKTGNYAAISPGASTTYQTTMIPDMYDQATLNVIPDMNQSTSDGLCDVISISGGEYVVRTPLLTKLPVIDANGSPLVPGDNGCPPLSFASERARLPYALKASDGMNLSDGDVIPDGFMGLWEEGAGLVLGLTFKLSDEPGYDSDYCVIVSGATLSAVSNKYRLVTVGTTVTEALARTTRRFDTHSHRESQGGFPISHVSLIGNHISPDVVLADWSITLRSPQSQTTGNHHPQYLCRYGWANNLDVGQYDNAMLGDLFMAAVQTDYITNSYNSDTPDSRKIYFGSSTGPYLYFDTSVNRLAIDATTGARASLQIRDNLYIGNSQSNRYAYFGPTTGQWNYIRQSNTDGFSLRENNSVATSKLQCGYFMVHNNSAEQDVDYSFPPSSLELIRMGIFDDSPNSTHDALIHFQVDDAVYGGLVTIGLDGYNSTIADSAFIISGTVGIYLDTSSTLLLQATSNISITSTTGIISLQANTELADGKILKIIDGSNSLWIYHDNVDFYINSTGEDIKIGNTSRTLELRGNPVDLNTTKVNGPISVPGSPSTGSFYFDTSVSPRRIYVYDGSNWKYWAADN